MRPIDQYHDPVLAVLIKTVEGRPKLAAEVMEVDIDPEERDQLPNTAFAWPEKRAFPIHTRGHAIVSRTYRESAGLLPAHVDATLKEACDVYGVDERIFERPKVAAADDSGDFLLPDIRRLRVTEPDHVKVAERKLLDEGRTLSPGSRMLASARLVEKAALHGVRVGDEIRKMAGLTVTDTRVLADWLEARGEAAPTDHKDGYRKLARETLRMGPEIRDRAIQEKLASAIENLDEAAGIDAHWGRKLPDPVRTVFNTTKVAGHGVMLGGQFVPIERIAAYPASFYSDILGPDFAREATDPHKLATVLGTLPLDMQRVLVQNMR